MKLLWLFDIDGTLVEVNDLHLLAHKASFKEIMDLNPSESVLKRNFGLPGKKYREAILSELGIRDFSKIPLLEEKFNQHLINEVIKKDIQPLKGVVDFLEYLTGKENNKVGIITGNREDGGTAILKKANLLQYFSVFGFDKGKSREEMLSELITLNPNYKTIVIGDTDKDVNAGKFNHCITVAVATGSRTFKELERETPDVLLRSFEEYSKIISNRLCRKSQ